MNNDNNSPGHIVKMEASPESSHTSYTQDSHQMHHISCTNCRKRKIKCNRVEPCAPCLRTGVECIFRARAPRSQNKGKDPKSRETELLLRLSRLEGLVSKIDPAAIREARGESAEHSPPTHIVGYAESPTVTEAHSISSDHVDGEFSSFVRKQQHWSRHVSSDFWNNLSGEIDGLRQLLEEPMDDWEAEDDTNHLKLPKHVPPYFLFGESDPQNLDNEVPYPSVEHRTLLFQYYFENVDPIFKVLHRPTAEKFLTNANELIDESTHRFKFISLEAATFAMYFVTVASLTPEQCMQHFHENREALLVKYRFGTEVALLRGDFLNSTNIVFLHAFVLYIIALRASRNSQSCWTFIGLATRIAYSLGIHRDGDGSHLNVHEAEIRRRIWWALFTLDMKASEDRGCEPMLSEEFFNIRLPLNIEDEDFNKASPYPIHERKGITIMTYSLIAIETARVTRKLHFNPPTNKGPILTLQEKENLAKEYISRVDRYFADDYDPTNPTHLVIYIQSRMMILRLWLVSQYPMQRIDTIPSIQPRSRCLRHVVELLSIADSLEANDYASRFKWNIETSVSWHPLAVALAELCTETEGAAADEAWRIIDKHWEKWSLRVAMSREEKMWRPVRRLMKRAREARQKRLGGMGEVEMLGQGGLRNGGAADTHEYIQGLSLEDSGSAETPGPSTYGSEYAAQYANNAPPPIGNGMSNRTNGHVINPVTARTSDFDPSPGDNSANTNIFQTFTPINRGGGNSSWPFPPNPNTSSSYSYPTSTSTVNGTGNDPGMTMNWDDWNAFIYDAGSMGMDTNLAGMQDDLGWSGEEVEYMGEDIDCII